ncbi:hypothetical protein M8C21_019218 [Ambrosia artemisiifolia]|uniref:Uncharacterized protein n=1 Tax=Ambrosia artemisiifolia TaxID=4212 RepID=A0AAD5C916_AMBAR|nr:hypothetical protein M8C21_019218 [Ambrosia artemisiifolia]
MDRSQFLELALGLELNNRPFLWSGASTTVLNHPSMACFLSHRSWNSVLEGINSCIPLMCWSYFADQFINQRYVYDVWNLEDRITVQ